MTLYFNFILLILVNINNWFNAFNTSGSLVVRIQDGVSPQMEAVLELHDHVMFYLAITLVAVAWAIISVIRKCVFNVPVVKNYWPNNDTMIDLIWTVAPALMLTSIALISFKLLYLINEVTDPCLTVFVEWTYQCPDFTIDDNEELEFDCDLIPELRYSHILWMVDDHIDDTNSDDVNSGSESDSSNNSSSQNGSDDNDDNDHNEQVELDPSDVPELHSDMANCTHDTLHPYTDLSEEAQLNTQCLLNSTRLPNGTLQTHDAFVDGSAPSVCPTCGMIICRDCTGNLGYNSEDSLGSSPTPNNNDDSDSN